MQTEEISGCAMSFQNHIKSVLEENNNFFIQKYLFSHEYTEFVYKLVLNYNP